VRLPNFNAGHFVVLPIDVPYRAHIPTRPGAQSLDDLTGCLAQIGGLGESTTDRVLNLESLLGAIDFRDRGRQQQCGDGYGSHECLKVQQRIIGVGMNERAAAAHGAGQSDQRDNKGRGYGAPLAEAKRRPQ